MLSISFDRDSPNHSIPNSKFLLELSKNPALYGVKNCSGDEMCIFHQGTKLNVKSKFNHCIICSVVFRKLNIVSHLGNTY